MSPCLVLLDLLAMVHTWSINKILLQRLQHRYRIKGVVLKWLESYLTEVSTVCDDRQENYQNQFCSNRTFPRGVYLAPFCSPCTLLPWGTSATTMAYCTWCMQMTNNCMLPLKLTSQVHYVKCIKSIVTWVTDIQCWMNVNYLKLQ